MIHQVIDRARLHEIGDVNVHVQVRIARSEFLAQLVQSIASSCDQHERTSASGKLPRKFAPDPR